MTLKRYKVKLVSVPFPFECTVVALSEASAIKKAKFKSERCGLECGDCVEIEEIEEIKL